MPSGIHGPVPLPWLKSQWQQLTASRVQGRLPHALLFSGPAGVGKRHFALAFAQVLVCTDVTPEGVACGLCADCHLVSAGNHPDAMLLEPPEDSKSGEIPIDAVRRSCADQTLSPSRGDYKSLRVAPAEAMNETAANALLKTLEEPAASTIMLLISEQPSMLPATIRSRVQQLVLFPPSEDLGLAWLLDQGIALPQEQIRLLLRLAGDAPLSALALAGGNALESRDACFAQFADILSAGLDPVGVAQAWQQLDPKLVLDWVVSWVADLARLSCSPSARVGNPDKLQALVVLQAGLRAEPLHRFFRTLLAAKRLSGRSVNKQLLFESLLIEWARLGIQGSSIPAGTPAPGVGTDHRHQ